MIVKGGPDANVYSYPFDTFADNGLVPPMNPNNGSPYGLSHIEFCTDNIPEEPPPTPDLDFTIDKAGVETTATAGTTVDFTITVTNTGDLSFKNYTIDDPNCDETRTGANAGDTSFDPDNVWTYSCVDGDDHRDDRRAL